VLVILGRAEFRAASATFSGFGFSPTQDEIDRDDAFMMLVMAA
jgi:hypothetical protein